MANAVGTTVQIHESVREAIQRFILNCLYVNREDYNEFLKFGSDIPRSYLERNLRMLTEILHAQNEYGYDLEYLCAVDGLRKNPRTGEQTTEWIYYLDNLRYTLYPPDHTLPENVMQAHVHGVRQMYPILHNPREVHKALLRFYGSNEDYVMLETSDLPACRKKVQTLVMPALEIYYDAMGKSIDRMSEVARQLNLKLDDDTSCYSNECIACNERYDKFPAIYDEKLCNRDDITVRVDESVRQAILRNLIESGNLDKEDEKNLLTDDVSRNYLLERLWPFTKREILGKYNFDFEYLCAVDGLRATDDGYWTKDWIFYMDNLKYPLIPPPETSDALEAHANGVRRMYPILRNPDTVNDALLQVYKHEDFLPCLSFYNKRLQDLGSESLIAYFGCVDEHQRQRVAERWGLALVQPEWRPGSWRA